MTTGSSSPMTTRTARAMLAPDAQTETRYFLVLLWAIAVATTAIGYGPFSLSPDDAMRLVEVRDLIAGQSWFDLTQYRLDPPAGVVMHWSRLVDLPLAGLILAGKAVAPAGIAERAAMTLWPALLLFAFLAGTMQLARALAGETAARIALLLAVLMASTLQHFRPGSIHHHNVQLTLLVWSLALFVKGPQRPRAAAGAGLLGAVSVGVGQEMVPAIATLAVVAALRWIVDGERVARATFAYAVTLAVGTIALGALTIPPADYLLVRCDSLSIAQVGALTVGGLGLASLTLPPLLHTPQRRLAAAGLLAVVLAACLGLGAGQCIGDPYAQVDPRLKDLWLSSVSEARGIAAMAHDLPQQIPAYFGVALAALVLGISQAIRSRDDTRWHWLAAAGVQAALLLVALWQVRGTAGANAVAAALFAAAVVRSFPARDGERVVFGLSRAALIAVLLINPATLLPIGSAGARALGITPPQFLTSGQAGTCQQPADYAPLADLPRGRVLAFIDSGPFILMRSDDAVFGGPYHRNVAGNLAILDMFLAAPADAARQMAARGIDYVAFCPGAPERHQYAALAPHGLAAALAKDEAPAFLARLPTSGTDLALYRVRR